MARLDPNADGQHHTDAYVPLAGPDVELRYADPIAHAEPPAGAS
jgi:hypothetical protein